MKKDKQKKSLRKFVHQTNVCNIFLRECLILQLEHVKDASNETLLALKILQVYFDDFIKKHYDKIKKALAISDKELKSVIDIIIKLNPKPGAAYYIVNKVHHHITPDFFIDESGLKLGVRVLSNLVLDYSTKIGK